MIEIEFKCSNYLLICSKDKGLIDIVKVKLSEWFSMKDVGMISKYTCIGINVEYDFE